MPSLSNISIYKNDGTTVIVYEGVQPSSGDATPAVWRATAVGNAPAHAPEFRLTARDGAKGARRVMRGTYQYPQLSTNASSGLTTVVDRVTADVNFSFPRTMTQSDINEAVAQFRSVLGSDPIGQCFRTGFSAS